MEIDDIKSAEQAKQLSAISNFWTDTGNQALFFVVDANFFVLLPILCFKVNEYTVGLLVAVFVFLSLLRKKDVTFMEFLSKARIWFAGSKYRRRK